MTGRKAALARTAQMPHRAVEPSEAEPVAAPGPVRDASPARPPTPGPQPAARRLGVVMLCHDALPVAARMARIWAEGGAALVIHVDAKAPEGQVARMREALADLPDVSFSPRHRCGWGRFSLVGATLEAAAQLLGRHDDIGHVYLASGSCLPLRPISDLRAYLARHPQTDFIESVLAAEVGWTIGGLDMERFTLYFPLSWRDHRSAFDLLTSTQRLLGIKRRMPAGLSPHLGSQWWCLTAATLRRILDDPRRGDYARFFQLSWIPDESYFQTLVRRHSDAVESRSLTLAQFDAQGKPYLLYDDHAEMLEQSGCFVARKVWPGSEGLFRRFPLPARDKPDTTEPRPARIERLIQRAAQRRKLGRPGLYMQSRFPVKDAENGKTSAPYAVFQGFSDLFPGFREWLAEQVPEAIVHGHLLSPDEVEFAGDARVGPGALSTSAALRDHDPQGFLASLIRSRAQMQMFQLSPRDSQELNWFMVTDPNARMSVITGAWVVPLLGSEMPFDDIRRVAALMQRAEKEQLKVLDSVWVKARAQVWDLADFLARPMDTVMAALRQIDPTITGLATPLPQLRDISGLVPFLQRLNNAGLKIELAGDFGPGYATLLSDEDDSDD